ncbi:hypothetical protein BTVI_109608 [Pitangus sulphuratus]|nr:hypothetical protein BTVI_109608 [Pitangus sulphuratus]
MMLWSHPKALNQVVLWDKIMLRGDNPRLSLKDMKSKYFFFDDGNGLKGNRNITLTLSWNVVPNAGILPLVTGSGRVSVPFPDTYETTKIINQKFEKRMLISSEWTVGHFLSKCLVTFTIVLFRLSLGLDQSFAENERILTVKVCDRLKTLE